MKVPYPLPDRPIPERRRLFKLLTSETRIEDAHDREDVEQLYHWFRAVSQLNAARVRMFMRIGIAVAVIGGLAALATGYWSVAIIFLILGAVCVLAFRGSDGLSGRQTRKVEATAANNGWTPQAVDRP